MRYPLKGDGYDHTFQQAPALGRAVIMIARHQQ